MLKYKMKSLIQYINEAVEIYRLNSLECTYNVQPEEIILQAPETFQETDIQQYMDDMWLNQLPSGQDYSNKFFGSNSDNIIDVHFEYDTFEHIDIEPKTFIKWDPKYDVKKSSKDIKLDYFRIRNLKYVIEFDRFDMVGVDDDTVKDKLIDLFKTTESNTINKYPIEIQFDSDSLEYRK